jgi:hypothetical protein
MPVDTNPGVEIAIAVGPSFAIGEAESGVPLAGQVGAPPAFAVDIGYRFDERLSVLAVWATGFGLVAADPCRADYRCPGPMIVSDLGAVARYRLGSSEKIDPWIGAGLAFAVQGGSAKRSELVGGSSGFCIINCGATRVEFVETTLRYGLDALVEGGIDWRKSKKIGFGLTLSTFVGKYLAKDVKEKRDGEEIASGGGSLNGSLHAWVLVSGRVVFDF